MNRKNMTSAEIREDLKISRSTLWRLVASGSLPKPLAGHGKGVPALWDRAAVERAMRARPVTVTAAARLLGVSRMTLHRWAKAGRVPPPPYSPAQVADMLSAQTVQREILPTRRPNITIDTVWNGHPIIVTIGYDPAGVPREVFANTPRGGDIAATMTDACVLISIALQHGIPREALAKSLGRIPDLRGGNIPASPVGAILETMAKHGD